MTFPLAKFRALFPQFADVADATVELWAEQALCLINERGCECEEMQWMLLTAHMLTMNGLGATAAAGGAGNIASASIDKVSVSFSEAKSDSAWSYWLNGSPFGRQLLAMLAKCRPAGGMYAGSMPERHAFKGVYGMTARGRR